MRTCTRAIFTEGKFSSAYFVQQQQTTSRMIKKVIPLPTEAPTVIVLLIPDFVFPGEKNKNTMKVSSRTLMKSIVKHRDKRVVIAN